jgi:hypothetical protein
LTLRSLQRRNHLELLQERLNLFGLLALNSTYNYVFPTLVASAGLIEHAIGLAYAGSIAQKNLEFRSPASVFFGLDLFQEPLGTRSREFGYAHCGRLPVTV